MEKSQEMKHPSPFHPSPHTDKCCEPPMAPKSHTTNQKSTIKLHINFKKYTKNVSQSMSLDQKFISVMFSAIFSQKVGGQ